MDDLPEVCTPVRGIHEVGESLSLRTQAGLGAHRASKGVHRQQEANLAFAREWRRQTAEALAGGDLRANPSGGGKCLALLLPHLEAEERGDDD